MVLNHDVVRNYWTLHLLFVIWTLITCMSFQIFSIIKVSCLGEINIYLLTYLLTYCVPTVFKIWSWAKCNHVIIACFYWVKKYIFWLNLSSYALLSLLNFIKTKMLKQNKKVFFFQKKLKYFSRATRVLLVLHP